VTDPKGFLKWQRELPEDRPIDVRRSDWEDVHQAITHEDLETQALRCMDCGIPFCHNGCPLGNLIPEWNDLVGRSDWQNASERLHATNNFPDFTGRLCPAPCEAACVLNISPKQTSGAVTIKRIEQEIADRAFEEGWLPPQVPTRLSGKTVAVVGSGPAGLAAAQQLTRAGHTVVVYERADRIGGLLRYGIPEFKMEKWVLNRRLEQMKAEGTKFRPRVEVGVDITARELKSSYDAVVLAIGSTVGRDLPATGRELGGIHQAMEYLPIANRVQEGDLDAPTITAEGKHVVIIGGGDTGSDCLGTAIRQKAASITQLEILPRPPQDPDPGTPWPTWPLMWRVSTSQEEGGERRFAVSTQEFIADEHGNVRALRLVEVRKGSGGFEPVPGTEFEIPAQLVLLAMGFTGPEKLLAEQFGIAVDARGNLARDDSYATSLPGVFVAGDAGRGQSLIVWAIAEGRGAAAAVDRFLTGIDLLPVAVTPTTRPLTA
jgi:glutamate synthase (NADPH/NADH) small chain